MTDFTKEPFDLKSQKINLLSQIAETAIDKLKQIEDTKLLHRANDLARETRLRIESAYAAVRAREDQE